MTKHTVINNDTTNGHAFFLYNDVDERHELLTAYLKQGLDNNELCILVTSELPNDILQSFSSLGFDAKTAYKNQSLRIFKMNQTYLPDGQFSADYMFNNVATFINEAKADGYNGLRTAGEMSWLAERPEYAEAAEAYEHNVNNLCTPDLNFIGLCLYPVQDAFTDILASAARTHPSFIHDGQIQSNKHYSLA